MKMLVMLLWILKILAESKFHERFFKKTIAKHCFFELTSDKHCISDVGLFFRVVFGPQAVVFFCVYGFFIGSFLGLDYTISCVIDSAD